VGLRDLRGRTEAAASALAFGLILAARLLPLLFGAPGERLLDLGCGAAELLFELRDALGSGLQLLLQGADQIEQALGIDPSGAEIVFELLVGVAPLVWTCRTNGPWDAARPEMEHVLRHY
jgi:hypothetical protein